MTAARSSGRAPDRGVYHNNGYNHKKNPNHKFKKYMDVYYNGILCNIFSLSNKRSWVFLDISGHIELVHTKHLQLVENYQDQLNYQLSKNKNKNKIKNKKIKENKFKLLKENKKDFNLMKNKIKIYYENIQDDFYKKYNYKLNYYQSNYKTMEKEEIKNLRGEIDQFNIIKKEKYILKDNINIPHVYSKDSFYNKIFFVMKLVKEGTPFEEAVLMTPV